MSMYDNYCDEKDAPTALLHLLATIRVVLIENFGQRNVRIDLIFVRYRLLTRFIEIKFRIPHWHIYTNRAET